MKRQGLTFAVAGLVAGLICVTLVSVGTPETAIIGLTWLVGPLFFGGIVAGIIITGAWRYVQAGPLRYLVALLLCIFTYGLALLAFFAVFGFSPDWLGFQPSSSIAGFGVDVWFGLIAAGAVGASGITLFGALLTRTWSTPLLLRLMMAGLVAVSVTFLANLPFHKDWSFYGVLFPVGNALFCYFVGVQIWQHHNSAQNPTA